METILKKNLNSNHLNSDKNTNLENYKDRLIIFLEKYGHTKKTAEKEVENFLNR